jgi:hypothetical protein
MGATALAPRTASFLPRPAWTSMSAPPPRPLLHVKNLRDNYNGQTRKHKIAANQYCDLKILSMRLDRISSIFTNAATPFHSNDARCPRSACFASASLLSHCPKADAPHLGCTAAFGPRPRQQKPPSPSTASTTSPQTFARFSPLPLRSQLSNLIIGVLRSHVTSSA